MAKKNTPNSVPANAKHRSGESTTATEPNTTALGANKAQAIREYATANPNAKPSDIVKALVAQGIEVNASRVSTVLGNGKKRTGVDVDGIKAAAAFVKSYGGKIQDAEAAIRSVGDFVESCGSAAAALEALATYQAVAESIR